MEGGKKREEENGMEMYCVPVPALHTGWKHHVLQTHTNKVKCKTQKRISLVKSCSSYFFSKNF